MDTKENIKTNIYGQAILSSNHLKDLLLQGHSISHLTVIKDEEIDLYEQYQEDLLKFKTVFLDNIENNETFDEFHRNNSNKWIFPIEYQQIDVLTWLLDKCTTQEQRDRVQEEFILFEQRDLIMLLRLFIFLVSYMRKNNYVWGVGRGSSVASYILFLIGVHRVDSLRYHLDIHDYLK